MANASLSIYLSRRLSDSHLIKQASKRTGELASTSVYLALRSIWSGRKRARGGQVGQARDYIRRLGYQAFCRCARRLRASRAHNLSGCSWPGIQFASAIARAAREPIKRQLWKAAAPRRGRPGGPSKVAQLRSDRVEAAQLRRNKQVRQTSPSTTSALRPKASQLDRYFLCQSRKAPSARPANCATGLSGTSKRTSFLTNASISEPKRVREGVSRIRM